MATITTRYHTINGQIRAESSSSVFPSLIYLPDSLGNVTQVVTNTTAATSVARRRYRAYGTLAYQAPTTYAGPLFNYAGALGCRRTGRSHAGIQMGARVFSPTDGRFITRVRTDQFLDGENPYGYAKGNPTTYADPSGLSPGQNSCIRNTQAYANSYRKTGNLFEKCAATVSGNLCQAIVSGALEAGEGQEIANDYNDMSQTPTSDNSMSLAFAGAIFGSAACAINSLSNATLAQNQCMRNLWNQKTTPEWKRAHSVCSATGTKSKACCQASVLAEQAGYNACAKKVFPALGSIPYSARIYFALDVLKCCG